MDYEKSLENLKKALDELSEENKKVPVIVEGEKDIEALRKLGLTGEIITVNVGMSLTEFCDHLARKFKEIIILTDWDRRGGYLCHTIRKNLQGRVKCNTYYREVFAKNAMIRTVEGLPSWIVTMGEKIRINNKI